MDLYTKTRTLNDLVRRRGQLVEALRALTPGDGAEKVRVIRVELQQVNQRITRLERELR